MMTDVKPIQRSVRVALDPGRAFELFTARMETWWPIDTHSRAATEFDDAGRSVSYRFQVAEGPQYRMGDLTITGLDEVATNNLRVRWRLLSKEVYDEGYVEEFVKKSVPEFQRDAARAGNAMPALKVVSQAKPDHDKRLVHVTLNIKRDAAPTPPPTPQ